MVIVNLLVNLFESCQISNSEVTEGGEEEETSAVCKPTEGNTRANNEESPEAVVDQGTDAVVVQQNTAATVVGDVPSAVAATLEAATAESSKEDLEQAAIDAMDRLARLAAGGFVFNSESQRQALQDLRRTALEGWPDANEDAEAVCKPTEGNTGANNEESPEAVVDQGTDAVVVQQNTAAAVVGDVSSAVAAAREAATAGSEDLEQAAIDAMDRVARGFVYNSERLRQAVQDLKRTALEGWPDANEDAEGQQ